MKRIYIVMTLVILCACSINNAGLSSKSTPERMNTNATPSQPGVIAISTETSKNLVNPTVTIQSTATQPVTQQPTKYIFTTPSASRTPKSNIEPVEATPSIRATATMQETQQPTENIFTTPTVPQTPKSSTVSVEVSTSIAKPLKSPNGKIFYWTMDHLYVQLTQLSNLEPTIIGNRLQGLSKRSQDELIPNNAVNLAFGVYSPKVAYLTSNKANPDDPRELWIADAETKNTKKVWVDTNNWLGGIELIADNQDSEMIWGPGDRYVLITSYLDEYYNHTVIYDLEKETADTVTGSCNVIVLAQENQKPEIWCKLQGNGRETFAALGTDGLQYQDQPPKQIIAESLAWRISPDGKRIVFLGQDYQWNITGLNGDVTRLPFRYNVTDDPYYGTAGARNIVWSADGQRILIYGEDQSQKYCPPQKSEYTNESKSWPCWLVVDSNSGSVIWWPDLDMQKENTLYSYNLVMSPDGEWLMTTLANGSIGHLFTLKLFSVSSRYTKEINIDPFLLPAYYIQWH